MYEQAKKNSFSKELMHKKGSKVVPITVNPITVNPVTIKETTIKETKVPEDTIYSTNEETRSLRQVNRLRSAGAKGDQAAIKMLANREWYQKHKAWKKAYNKQYYQGNKDYWQNYYKYTHDMMKYRQRTAQETASGALKAKAQYGESSEQYKKAKSIADANAEWAREREADFKAAKLNLDRMVADEKWFNDNTKRTPVTQAWLDGTRQIRDVGKSVMSKASNVAASALSGFADSIKGLFSKK